MKCSDVRRHLGILEDLRRPTASVRDHLTGCSACRQWYRQLLRAEQDLPKLKVPASTGKTPFLDKVLSGAVPLGQPTDTLVVWNPKSRDADSPFRNRGQQKLALVTALAAGLLLFAAAFSALQWPQGGAPGKPMPVVDPLTVKYLKPIEEKLKSAPATEKMETLAAVAQTVLRESLSLAQQPGTDDDLRALASWYRNVLQPQLVTQAGYLPRAERPDVLGKIASEFDQICADTEEAARIANGRSAAASLTEIAKITRSTSQQLRAIISA
jgi:hypothetical protein